MSRFNHPTFEGNATPHPPRCGMRRSYRQIALMLTLRKGIPTSENQVRRACAIARRSIALALMTDPIIRRALAADANRLRASMRSRFGDEIASATKAVARWS